jgi:protein-disulfide isomerase
LAKKIGLNVDKLMKDLKDKDAEYEEIINKDTQLSSAVDVRGTPTFFINGKKTMARDVESIKAVIEKELAAKGGK